jgi:hypothetical protein
LVASLSKVPKKRPKNANWDKDPETPEARRDKPLQTSPNYTKDGVPTINVALFLIGGGTGSETAL